MVKIVWIIGKQGSGKTTWAERATGENLSAHIYVGVGKLCRHIIGEKLMSNYSNPVVPEETEQIVRKYVCDRISTADDGQTVIVDSMPKSKAQVRWIFEEFFNVQKFTNTFLLVGCRDSVCEERINSRDSGDENKILLNNKRRQSEKVALYEVLEEVLKLASSIDGCTFNTAYYDNSSEFNNGGLKYMDMVYSDSVSDSDAERIRYDYSISSMLRANNQFSDITLKKADPSLTMQLMYEFAKGKDTCTAMCKNSVWTRRFVERAIEELQELLDELPHKWWTDDMARLREARVELIDAWHFMLSAITSLGMDEKTFVEAYYAKRSVNLKRQAVGYLKRSKVKGDDNAVAKFEG